MTRLARREPFRRPVAPTGNPMSMNLDVERAVTTRYTSAAKQGEDSFTVWAGFRRCFTCSETAGSCK